MQTAGNLTGSMTNGILEVKETTKIKAKIANLPITDLSRRFMVEVLEPVHLVPKEVVLPLRINTDNMTSLKEVLLEEWRFNFSHLNDEEKAKLPEWMLKVNDVDLIPCDLLVPIQGLSNG